MNASKIQIISMDTCICDGRVTSPRSDCWATEHNLKSAPAATRKWTATVSVGGCEFPVESKRDTLRETVLAGKKVAEDAINEEAGSDACLTLYKQLKGDDEPKRDRSFYGYRDWNGSGNAVVIWS